MPPSLSSCAISIRAVATELRREVARPMDAHRIKPLPIVPRRSAQRHAGRLGVAAHVRFHARSAEDAEKIAVGTVYRALIAA